MGLRLITPPASDPLTLAQAKAHLRVNFTDDDALITALVKAATLRCENWTGRALVDQKWELVLDGFPSSTQTNMFSSSGEVDLAIMIPKPPLIEITQVLYNDTVGDEQIMSATNYYVDSVSQPGWLVPSGISAWPATIDAINCVRIQFRAGYLSADSPPVMNVPEDVLAGVKLMLGALYEHREQQVVGNIVNSLPFGVEQLLRHHRVLLGMA